MTEGLIIAMIIAGALALLAMKMQSLPVMFVSSIGWAVISLQIYDQTSEVLPMILILMLAFAQFFIVKGGYRA